MRGLLFSILLLGLGFSNSDLQSQNIESDCECDVIITDEDQSFPYNGYQESRDKTICFQGDFDYEINWNNLGDNITLCVGENVTFESQGLNFEGSKTIYNYGEFEYGQSIDISSDSFIYNYGKMESKFAFNGGALQNINNADLLISGYSHFNSGSLFNDYNSKLELEQGSYTTFGSDMVFTSEGEAFFEGDIENKGNLTLGGVSEFNKKLINTGFTTLSGRLAFEEGYNSNSNDAVTVANGVLEIDGNVNLWNGSLEASAGLEFSGRTTIENNAKLKFLGEAKFEDLTLRGEIFSDFSCNTLDIKKMSGHGGKLSANSGSSIYVKRFNKIPNSWVLTGNVSKDKCDNGSEVVVWTGEFSTDTDNNNNWSGRIRNNSSILIPKTRNNPVIGKSFKVFDVFVREDAELTNKSSLELSGNLKAEGKLNSKEGEVYLKGDKPQVITLNSKAEVGTLVTDNRSSVSLEKGSLDIFKSIDLINGDLNTNSNVDNSEENLITFKSDSVHTAILSEVKNGNRIIGSVRTERYLPSSNRAYRYLSSSVNSIGSIRDDWQEGVNNTVNNYASNQNPNPGYGTHITGNKQGLNGFDASLTGNASLFTWDISSGTWKAISNTNQNKLEVGKSYSLLVRGDRSTNIYSSNSAYTGSTTLRSKGELITGDVDVSEELNPTAFGFSLIGNPYQAQVDLKKALRESSSHLKQNFYYAWSPALQTSGGYVTVDLDSDPVQYIPARTTNNPTNQESFRYIQPNQSVFVETAASASEGNRPSLVFKESHKTGNTFSNEAFSVPEQVGMIDLTLIRNNSNQIVDGVRFKFNENYSNEVNENDATKVWNNEESFSILTSGANYLAIEKREYPEADEKLTFWIGNYTTQDYTMLIKLTDIEGYDVFMKDNYTDEVIQLENDENKLIFSVDASIAESKASDRFEITFDPVTLSTQNNELANKIQLYPNPSSSGTVFLKHDDSFGQDFSVEVYSMVGQKVEIPTERVSNTEVKLNTTSLSTGIYLVKSAYQSQTTTQKLVIQ
ncbi:T9SS type A sorting domain-containing protein [Psychroflexus montanilacus]|uniref:T9SS type A sorting domain-containing protein n=1 Tax=Psychroflexus montanilacus TaxID=2873598 RepID=UPI001CCB4402|nr:T9SS type A sorting domain-containing protein [Psychroflexus montanilacus]MBZ9650817.1 T9SS type A sorting domain-containing protein [Psychroflexus montanilacus]